MIKNLDRTSYSSVQNSKSAIMANLIIFHSSAFGPDMIISEDWL